MPVRPHQVGRSFRRRLQHNRRRKFCRGIQPAHDSRQSQVTFLIHNTTPGQQEGPGPCEGGERGRGSRAVAGARVSVLRSVRGWEQPRGHQARLPVAGAPHRRRPPTPPLAREEDRRQLRVQSTRQHIRQERSPSQETTLPQHMSAPAGRYHNHIRTPTTCRTP
ncbi:hypothetical protein AAG570_003857 [Ranatra chinensis]|uniref:Uncharacterized protein n=1 Tax=Ranatra chinensis TaxID=642074 RepID=A0ABD0Y249_9HEMI